MLQLSRRRLGVPHSAVLQFSSDPNCPEIAQRPQVRGSVSETGPTSDTSGKGWVPRLPPALATHPEAPTTPTLGSITKRLPYYHHFGVKSTAQGQPDGSCRGQGMGERPLGGHPPSTPMFTDQQLPESCQLEVCLGGPFQRQG